MLRVLSCCTYRTTERPPWSRQDYDAHDFVQAVKGKPFEGFVEVISRGRTYSINSDNCDVALEVFARIAADAGGPHGVTPRVVLVPVPNSRCDIGSSEPPRTRAQAEALALELAADATVADVLRWMERLPSARAHGGPRDPEALYAMLRVDGARLGRRIPVVLIDDVITSGGHLLACAAALRDHGCCVKLAVVAGRSDRDQVARPFEPRIDELGEFTPRRHQCG